MCIASVSVRWGRGRVAEPWSATWRTRHAVSVSNFSALLSFGRTSIVKSPDVVGDPWKGYEKAQKHPELKRTKIVSFQERLQEFGLISLEKRRKEFGLITFQGQDVFSCREGKAVFSLCMKTLARRGELKWKCQRCDWVLGRIRAHRGRWQNATRTCYNVTVPGGSWTGEKASDWSGYPEGRSNFSAFWSDTVWIDITIPPKVWLLLPPCGWLPPLALADSSPRTWDLISLEVLGQKPPSLFK